VKSEEPSLDLHNPIHVNNPPMKRGKPKLKLKILTQLISYCFSDNNVGYAASEAEKSVAVILVPDWCLNLLIAFMTVRWTA
jgi:hypothetical protein